MINLIPLIRWWLVVAYVKRMRERDAEQYREQRKIAEINRNIKAMGH